MMAQSRFKQTLVFSLLVTCLIWVPVVSAQSEKRVRGIKGQKAPSWEVESWHQLPEGQNSLNVSDYKDKVLYLYFFQSWCPGCHKSGFPSLKKVSEKYKDDSSVKFVVIQTTFEGHGVNTVEKLKPTAAKYDLTMPFGQSKGSSGSPDIMKKYRSGGTPWVVIIDKSGVVRFNDFHISPENAGRLIDSLK